MSKRIKRVWIVVYNSDDPLNDYAVFLSKKDALAAAKEWVTLILADSTREGLSAEDTLIALKKITVLHGDVKKENLPLHSWAADYEYFIESQKLEREELDYKRYLDLRSRFEDRFRKESQKGILNCS